MLIFYVIIIVKIHYNKHSKTQKNLVKVTDSVGYLLFRFVYLGMKCFAVIHLISSI